jgi:Iap family predicted aminopeptidase
MGLAKTIASLGEAVHGSSKEREVLKLVESALELKPKVVSVKTKEWVIENFAVRINGKETRAALLPYTAGQVEGVVGKEVALIDMPPHPFDLKPRYCELVKSFEAVLVYDSGKLRRLAVPGTKPGAFVSERPKEGDHVEIYAKAYLRETESYNLEYVIQEGEEYFVLGAHVDHWLTGYHDNAFSVEVLADLLKEIPRLRRGVKLVFFSSEEGPRCCTGSSQHPKDDTFVMVSLDALYPDKVVFSSTPDLWLFAELFPLKRVEMTTPFSDHFPYVTEGYPGLVLYNDDLIPYYHSDADLPSDKDEAYKRELIRSIVKFLVGLDKLSREELDAQFFRFAESRGVKLAERRNALVPFGLTTKFRGEK